MNIKKSNLSILTEMNDFDMIDSLIDQSSTVLNENQFHLDFSDIKKELMESSDITILKAAARNLKDVFNANELPATTITHVSEGYAVNVVELMNMFESLYGDITSFHTALVEQATINDHKANQQKAIKQSQSQYRTLAGIQSPFILEDKDTSLEEKVKQAHHTYPQSAHDWVSVRVEELYPKHISDKGEAYGRAWNEYKKHH